MSGMNGASPQPGSKRPKARHRLRSRLALGFRIAAGIFLAVHIYVLMLKFMPVPGSLLMVQRAVEGEHIARRPVPLADISPHLVRAVIAAEDTGFCAHHGVDPDAISKALAEYRAGKGLRGASTITQQTAKNAVLINGGGLVRKGAEAWFAVLIDFAWDKRRVMEVYLNLAEWGDGVFGAQAAAQVRFGKPASQLTAREAALLAAVLPSPNKWRLDPPGPYVRQRAATIEARMQIVARDDLDTCVRATR